MRAASWIVLTLTIGAFVAGGLLVRHGSARSPRLGDDWFVPAFSLVDQQGKATDRASLEGRVWIANFFFTSCTSVCPTLSARFRLVQRRLSDPRLRFVSFSVDPERDTPRALSDYANTWAKSEPRWSFLRTDPDSLQALVDGMRVVAEPTGDAKNPILHSSLFFLIDPRGRVHGMYDSHDELALTHLVRDAEALLGDAARGKEHAASGEARYRELCAGCHEDARLAPSLRGIWDKEVALFDGKTARVDAAYLRESVLEPRARRVAGYLDSMPAYGGQLSSSELEALLGHVRTLAEGMPAEEAPSTAARIERDPICGMSVRVTPDALHAERDGLQHYFCSAGCRTRFLAQ
jgi:protein SCO1/2